MAAGFDHSHTGNRHSLAPSEISTLLDLEESPRPQGKTRVAKEVLQLIRQMSRENPRWGASKIYGELLKLAFVIRFQFALVRSASDTRVRPVGP
jgi:hypothetical protein